MFSSEYSKKYMENKNIHDHNDEFLPKKQPTRAPIPLWNFKKNRLTIFRPFPLTSDMVIGLVLKSPKTHKIFFGIAHGNKMSTLPSQ
jgi:hypothetical protein